MKNNFNHRAWKLKQLQEDKKYTINMKKLYFKILPMLMVEKT